MFIINGPEKTNYIKKVQEILDTKGEEEVLKQADKLGFQPTGL